MLIFAGLGLLGLMCLVLLTAHLHQPPDAHRRIVSRSQAASRPEERMAFPWPEGDINPNSASLSLLDTLPGVGPAIAQRIVDERLLNGPFVYPEDLLTVSGIGEKTLQKLWEHLSLPPPTYQ